MKKLLALLSPLLLFAIPAVASAHAFGEATALPLPTGFYIVGGTAAFIASCVLLMFVRGGEREARSYSFTLPHALWGALTIILKISFVAVLLYAVDIGFFGEQVDENEIVALFWVWLVLVVPYVSAVVSGWWDIANPFKTIITYLLPRTRGSRVWEGEHFPALMGYAFFIIFELFLQNVSVTPVVLSCVLIGYTLYLWAGSLRWGASWQAHADFFSLFFHLAEKLSPLSIKDGVVTLSSPVRRLVSEVPSNLSLVAFITTALAATAFDGFHDSQLLWDIIFSISSNFYFLLFIAFLIFILAFFGLFALAMWSMKRASGGPRTTSAYMMRFASSLIPIVLAYHFAHYFSLLFAVLGIPIGADAIWYVECSVIVLGHIFAAYVGHKIALMEFSDMRRAVISQIPLMLLMVLYTAFGLWILSQPFAQNAL